MTDKTSWTKPPSLHRYGDSRPAVCGAEGVLGSPPPLPPEGGEEPRRPTVAQRSGAAASGRGPRGAEHVVLPSVVFPSRLPSRSQFLVTLTTTISLPNIRVEALLSCQGAGLVHALTLGRG